MLVVLIALLMSVTEGMRTLVVPAWLNEVVVVMLAGTMGFIAATAVVQHDLYRVWQQTGDRDLVFYHPLNLKHAGLAFVGGVIAVCLLAIYLWF